MNIFLGLISPEEGIRYLLEQGMFWREQMTLRLMLVVWLMLVASAGTWIFLGRTRLGYRLASVYWLGCGVGIWLSLYLPVSWVLPSAVFVISSMSFIFTFFPIWRYKWRWFHAWPGNLEILVQPYRPSSGIISSMTALSLVVFFLCLCDLSHWLTAVSSILFGISLLAVVTYEYRSETGLAGLMLVSLGLVSGFLAITGAGDESAPTVVNLVLIPLSLLSLFWIWLGKVWEQQIIEGKPLATAAKLVPLTRHAGVMLLAFSTLLGVKLSLWPIMPAVSGYDNHAGRFVLMSVAFVLLMVCNIGIARRMKISIFGVLAAFNLFSVMMAVVTRVPEFFHRVFLPNLKTVAIGYVIAAFLVVMILKRKNSKVDEATNQADR
jgi:hypothetical protein